MTSLTPTNPRPINTRLCRLCEEAFCPRRSHRCAQCRRVWKLLKLLERMHPAQDTPDSRAHKAAFMPYYQALAAAGRPLFPDALDSGSRIPEAGAA